MKLMMMSLGLAACLSAVGQTTIELAKRYPVDFKYDGTAFAAEAWGQKEIEPGKLSYLSPDGKLKVTVEYKTFPGYPVTEIIPVFECAGDAETGIVEAISSLYLTRKVPAPQVRVRTVTGSKTSYTDFTRHDALLQHRHGCDFWHITTDEGASCSTWIPYFGVDFDSMNGIEVAVGWTGAWRADMQKTPDGYWLKAGFDGAHFKMLPGEKFMLPTILVFERQNQSVADGLVLLHRFILEHKSPRDSKGRLFEPWMPASASGGNKTDANMLMILDFLKKEFPGVFNVFWIDANWYGKHREIDQNPNCGPGWFEHAGDWHANTWAHPDGNMKRVSDAAHAQGMKFLVWFESERATENAPIVKEHPEYFLRWKVNPSPNHYLLKLGDPEARKWIVEEVCRNIEESGIDIYRQDFNWGGGERRTWCDNDTPDRAGVNEIKHINGLYAFWDELRRRYPDMLLENCASGGRRMDYQMMSRAHSYCRDDAHMFPNADELTQNITLNTTAYLPITGGETFTVPVFDDYAFLSRLGAGTVFTPTDFQGMLLHRQPSKEELDWFRRMFAVAKRIQPYFLGDYYALTDNPFDSSEIYCAYQLNDPQKGEGFFAVFRRKDCKESTYRLALHAIDADATYVVDEVGKEPVEMSGRALATWTMEFAKPRTTRWVFYRKK